MTDQRKILAIDFDGVVHSYERGWQNGAIYGSVTRGFFEWCERVGKDFRLVIYSSRSATPRGVSEMRYWLVRQWHDWNRDRLNQEEPPGIMPDQFEFAHQKPPAWLTIDDRCVRFDGSWDNPLLSPRAMLDFEPWTLQVSRSRQG